MRRSSGVTSSRRATAASTAARSNFPVYRSNWCGISAVSIGIGYRHDFPFILLRPRRMPYAKISSIDGGETHVEVQGAAPFPGIRMEGVASRLSAFEGSRHGDQEGRQNGPRDR